MKRRLETILFAVDVQLKKQEKMDLRNNSTRKDFNCQKFEFRWIHEREHIMLHKTNPLQEIKQKHEVQEVLNSSCILRIYTTHTLQIIINLHFCSHNVFK